MICHRCALRAARLEAATLSRRQFSQSTRRGATPIPADKITTPPRQGEAGGRNPPAATSTSAAQPFSAEKISSASSQVTDEKATKATAPAVVSSVAAGTPLRGLNFLKNAQDPVALPDEEYPPWLWTLLARKVKESSVEALDADVFAKSKKTRRKAAKQARKGAGDVEDLGPRIPLQEQTIDLPSGDGTLAGARDAFSARESLTKAMREKRRATIKEANFLKAMG